MLYSRESTAANPGESRIVYNISKSEDPPGTIHYWKKGPHIKRANGDWDPLSVDDDGKEHGPFGPIYRRFYHKPDAAIEFLLKKRDGEAVAAIHKDGIGDIDFVWDDPEKKGKAGLRHILKRRDAEHQENPELPTGVQFLRRIPEAIRSGIIEPDPKERNAVLVYSKEMNTALVINLVTQGQDKTWLLTGYYRVQDDGKSEADGKMGPDADDSESAGFSDSSLTTDYRTNSGKSQQKSDLPRLVYEAGPIQGDSKKVFKERPGLQPSEKGPPPTIHHSGSPGKSNLGGQGEDNSVPTKRQQKSSLTRVIYEASQGQEGKDKPGSESADLPPTPGTIHRNSPGPHLVGIENNTAGFRESKQKTSLPYQIQKAGLVPKMCEYCREWEASQPILRVFASYAEFARSKYYAGGDLMQNDPYAEYAVWPGKTNANRHYSDWWICTPVHPNCDHIYQSWEPPDENDYDFSEHFADLDRRMAERQQKAEEEYYGKSRIAPMEERGVWHERTCACEDPAHDDRGSWVREYIARRFPVVVG
ncbi:MAG: hypothetical protein KDK25_05635 [Leptospiraceae bacterium]|nr:hypothetical protein [Leptospiraceae bacterium]